MSSNSDPTGALLLGTGVGVFLFFKGFRRFREYKIVEDTPRMPIRSLSMGLAHIRGKALSDKLVASPITHTQCCFYQVKIERWKSDSHGGNWEHCRTDNDGSKFYLQDDTGKVLVDSYSAEYDLPGSPPRVVDSDKLGAAVGTGATDQELLQYVERAGVHQFSDKVGHWLEKKGPQSDPRKEQGRQMLMQLVQGLSVVSEGGTLPVDTIEKFMELRGPMPDAEKEQTRQMMLSHLREMNGGSIHLPQFGGGMASGRYRLREFLILPGEEYNVTGTCVENPNPCDDHDRCMMVKGQNERTFLVSWETEGESQKNLRKSAAGMVFGGAALTLVCLALLLAHLGLF